MQYRSIKSKKDRRRERMTVAIAVEGHIARTQHDMVRARASHH